MERGLKRRRTPSVERPATTLLRSRSGGNSANLLRLGLPSGRRSLTLALGENSKRRQSVPMDNDTTGIVRLVGLFGLVISLSVWGLAERSERRKVIVSLAAAAALISALVYFLGVMAGADSGAHRFLPRFP